MSFHKTEVENALIRLVLENIELKDTVENSHETVFSLDRDLTESKTAFQNEQQRADELFDKLQIQIKQNDRLVEANESLRSYAENNSSNLEVTEEKVKKFLGKDSSSIIGSYLTEHLRMLANDSLSVHDFIKLYLGEE